MPVDLFDQLNGLATPVSLKSGTVLFRRDEPSRSVYVVRSGRIGLLWPDAEESVPMETLGPGSIIGIPAAINGTYSVTAKALMDSDLGIVSAARFLEVLESDPVLCRMALRLMGQEVARTRSSIAEHCLVSGLDTES